MFSVSSDEKAATLRILLRDVGLESSRVVSNTVPYTPWITNPGYYNGIQKGLKVCGCCANLGAPVHRHQQKKSFQRNSYTEHQEEKRHFEQDF